MTSYCVMHSKVSHGGTPIRKKTERQRYEERHGEIQRDIQKTNLPSIAIIELANVCVGHLTSVGAGSSALVKRVTPPSAEELEAILVGGQLQCVVRLPGTATKIISKKRKRDINTEIQRQTHIERQGDRD